MKIMENGRLMFEDARIIWRNFSGQNSQFETDRTFTIVLTKEEADILTEEGWNVGFRQKDPEDDPLYFLKVKVGFKGKRPPKLVQISSLSKRQTAITEASVINWDWAEIVRADIIVNPSHWNVNGKSGIKAYVYSMYLTIYEDELEARYGNPDNFGSEPEAEDDIPF